MVLRLAARITRVGNFTSLLVYGRWRVLCGCLATKSGSDDLAGGEGKMSLIGYREINSD
jgi:hypothetical protein